MIAMSRLALVLGGLSLEACAHAPYGLPTAQAGAASQDAAPVPAHPPEQHEIFFFSLYSGPVGIARQVRYEGECNGDHFEVIGQYSSRASMGTILSFDFRVEGETVSPQLNAYIETSLSQFRVVTFDVESIWCIEGEAAGDYQINLLVVRELRFLPGEHVRSQPPYPEAVRDPLTGAEGFSAAGIYNMFRYNVRYNVNWAERLRSRGGDEVPLIYHNVTEITPDARYGVRIGAIAPFAEANCFGPVLGYPFTPEGCGDESAPAGEGDDE